MVSSTTARSKLRLAKVSVLVVDDDKAISNLIKNVLQNLGFGTVVVVHNAIEALDILEKTPVDLVISDWEMPQMNGVEMTRRIRAMDSNTRFTPIIMLTGHGEKQEIEMARDCGITEYIIKPFTAKSLCSRLTMVIDSPRSFIFSKGYKGPSRRRRNLPPPEGQERRIRTTSPQ